MSRLPFECRSTRSRQNQVLVHSQADTQGRASLQPSVDTKAGMRQLTLTSQGPNRYSPVRDSVHTHQSGTLHTHQSRTQCTLTSQGLNGHSPARDGVDTHCQELVVIDLSELEVVKEKRNWDKEMQDTSIYVFLVFLAQRRPRIVKR